MLGNVKLVADCAKISFQEMLFKYFFLFKYSSISLCQKLMQAAFH